MCSYVCCFRILEESNVDIYSIQMFRFYFVSFGHFSMISYKKTFKISTLSLGCLFSYYFKIVLFLSLSFSLTLSLSHFIISFFFVRIVKIPENLKNDKICNSNANPLVGLNVYIYIYLKVWTNVNNSLLLLWFYRVCFVFQWF